MIEQAQEEIMKMNQELLFQKADIKKKFKAKLHDDILKIQKNFEDSYTHFLNNSLNLTLLEINQNLLNLKLDIVKELKNEIILDTKKNIKDKYLKYIYYLIETIKKGVSLVNIDSSVNLIFNSKDFEYFKNEKNFKKVQDLFKSPLNIKESFQDFIGGFILEIPKLNLSYSNTIDDIIDKKSSVFEIELSKIISDESIENTKNNLIEFYNSQKTEINIIKGQLNNNE